MKSGASVIPALAHVTACICLATVSLAATGSMPAPTRLTPGLEYLHHQIGTGPLSIHVVKIDRTEPNFAFTASLAQDSVLGLQALSAQVQAVDPNLGRARVAVNGDFFRIRPGPYQGDPRGLQLCQGELVSSPQNLSFWVDAREQPHIGQVRADFRVTWPDKTRLFRKSPPSARERAVFSPDKDGEAGDICCIVDGAGCSQAGKGPLEARATSPTEPYIPFTVNQEPDRERAVLFAPSMGASTRSKDGLELVLERYGDSPWLPLRPGQVYQARIAQVNHDPNSGIASNNMILHVGKSLIHRLEEVETGDILTLACKTVPDLSGVRTAIGGGPLLIRKGRAQSFSGTQPRHPRTALGWNETHYLLLVVDGRQKDLSMGMTLPELANYMLGLGCTDAINLDGGGSSTLWLNGRIMNSPSDRHERWIANALVLLQKTRPSADR